MSLVYGIIKMKHYAVTLKWNTNSNPTQADYYGKCICPLAEPNKKLLLYNWAFETDSKNKIHLHLHVVCKYYHWKNFINMMHSEGFYINVQELKTAKDQSSWDNYLHKQKLSEHECNEVNCSNEIRQMDYPFIN